jgi:hypothetical protein
LILLKPGPLRSGRMMASTPPQRRGAMHPIWVELLTKPVGWLSLGGSIFLLVLLPLGIHLFLRKQIRDNEGGAEAEAYERRRRGELPPED